MIKRAVLIVLDSVGVGELPDASLYGDTGSNTIKNIYKSIDSFSLPNLEALGLLHIEGLQNINKNPVQKHTASVGRCIEISKGKDTTTGHWEISGIILDKPFPVFPNGFPKAFIEKLENKIGRKTIGNYPVSGTEIIKILGQEHIVTGNVIVYTSADSVFQIAAHEEVISLEELYKICECARELLTDELGVGRVIARPFIGSNGNFTRTKNRRDFSLKPPKSTMLDYIKKAGKEVFAIGKIEDIFAGMGITKSIHTTNNEDGIKETINALKSDSEGLIFTNLVDFDMLYGHRNNVLGYANALKSFDERLPEIINCLKENDILIITADHGCDPTTESTDHSREYIPLIIYGSQIKKNYNLGTLDTFSCIGKTILDLFNIQNDLEGYSVAGNIM